MPDNKNNSEEELSLPEGDHHELLGNPAELLEISAPEEVVLLDTIHEELQSLHTEAVGIQDISKSEEVTEVSPPVVESAGEQVVPVISETDPTLFDEVIERTPVASADPIEVIPEDIPTVPITVTEESLEPVVTVSPTEELGSVTVSAGVSSESPRESNQSQESVDASHTVPATPPESVSAMMPPVMHPVTAKKSHKTLIIAGVVGVLVIAGGTLVWAMMQGQSSDTQPQGDISYTISAEAPPTYEQMIQDKVQEDTNNINLMNQALTESDAGVCQRITSADMQVQCSESLLARELASSGTLADCQSITRTDIRSACESTLSQKEALSTMNKVLCNNIGESTQSQYCREAIDERVLMSLMETQTATPEKCRQLEEKHQSTCLASIVVKDDNSILQNAVQNDSLEDCKKLSTEELQYTCFDTILLKRALASKDKNLCDYVRDETKKTTCVSYTSTQDDNETFKSAIIDKDLNSCRTIQSESLKNRCLDSVTLLIVRDTKDASLCNTLMNTGAIDSCKKSVGVQ